MKRVLIISPHFPPINAADMHRVRQGLPYFRELGWEPVVITVDPKFIESYSIDNILLETLPGDIEIHRVEAYPVSATRKFGLGSLSMRSFFQFRKKGDELLKQRKFDLVYFSTTAFHVMALGPRWKRKFGVPFVLDIQDPWRNDFYLDKPKSQRPPKFRFAYAIDKFLEGRTVPFADGIISVSKGYIDEYINRYPGFKVERTKVIPFGAAEHDFVIMKQFVSGSELSMRKDKINFLYIGRGGHDMEYSLRVIFSAVQRGLISDPSNFNKFHFTFLGTSYAPKGLGTKTIAPIADKFGLADMVTEITDRFGYFESLYLLSQTDAIVIPGSTDLNYTASKVYPYVMARKPMLAVFHSNSSVCTFFDKIGITGVVKFDSSITMEKSIEACLEEFNHLIQSLGKSIQFNDMAFEEYTAHSRTKEQVVFFESVISKDFNMVSGI